MPSRRDVLRIGASTAALGLAGCLDGRFDGFDGGGGWQYDAGELFGAETVVAASVDLAAIREEPLPDPFDEELTAFDEAAENLDVGDVDAVEATAYFDDEDAGGTVVALGEFDPDALGEELRGDGLEPVESGYDVDGYEDDAGAAFALREDAVVFGLVDDRDGSGWPAVAAALDAEAGEVPRFAGRTNGETLQEELAGDATLAVDLGTDLREGLESEFEHVPGPFDAVVGATDAFGIDATVEGETTDLTYVFVADPEALDVETVREFADEVEDVEESAIDGVTVSRDGRAVVATAEADTEGLLESHFGILEAGRPSPQPATPNVSFDFQRTDDDRVRVGHQGGDSVDRPLIVRYDGHQQLHEEQWTETPITAGSSFVSEQEVRDGGTVRLVWENEDGTRAATLAVATF